MPRINESQNELVKVQVHELVYIASQIAYTTEWIGLFCELVNTETLVSIFGLVYLATWVNA